MQTAPLRVVLFEDQSADETTSQAVDCSAYPCVALFLKGSGTISSGVLTVEESDQPPPPTGTPDGRTWSTITTINAADVTGDVQKAYHLPSPYAYGFVRARISTVLGGTTPLLTVVLRAV